MDYKKLQDVLNTMTQNEQLDYILDLTIGTPILNDKDECVGYFPAALPRYVAIEVIKDVIRQQQ